MGYGPDRSKRGWTYAILLALLLTLAFFAVEQLAVEFDNQVVPTAQEPNHRGSETLVNETIFADAGNLEAREPAVASQSDWQHYRAQKNVTLVASIEPSANVRLAAPRAIPEMVDESIKSQQLAATDPFAPATIVFRTTSANQPSHVVEPKEIQPPTSIGAPLRTSVWPVSESLFQELKSLQLLSQSPDDHVTAWCEQGMDSLVLLGQLASLSDPRAASQLASLERSCWDVIELNAKANDLAPSPLRIQQLRLALAIQRRVSIWIAVYQCVSEQNVHFAASKVRSVDRQTISQALDSVRKLINTTGDSDGWLEYLQLEPLQSLAVSSHFNPDQVQQAVRVFLSRVSWQRLSPAQREFLASEPIQALASELHPLAMNPVDYRQVLIDLETLESSPTHRCSAALANTIETLRFAEQPNQIALASALNNNYRNANVRVAISNKLIERLMPQNTVIERPVRERILGAETRGASQIVTNLAVELVPDSARWNLKLHLTGDVQSSTRSSQGPATFHNLSHAAVDTTRQIQIDAQGFHIDSHATNVVSHDTLRGFDTSFDGLPLIGDLMRLVVRQQFDQKRGIAQRIVQHKIASQTDVEFDKQLHNQVNKAEKQIATKVYGPFERLQLEPLVVDLQTTPERLVARYRIANSDQMAANSPRPRAPSDSLVSLQLHESAINNALSRLELNEREWTIDELREKMSAILGIHLEPNKNDRPDVRIRFAAQSPITVRFAEGRLNLTLRIAEFSDAARIDIERFVAEISLKPTVSGMKAEFSQENLTIDGGRLHRDEKLVLRGIFAKIFEANPTLPLVDPEWIANPRLKGLAISQLELRDGWIALAVSEEHSPHIVQLRSRQSLLR